MNNDRQGVMMEDGTRFNLVYPGLSQTVGTVSLESYENSGFYLRHYDYDMDLEDPVSGR